MAPGRCRILNIGAGAGVTYAPFPELEKMTRQGFPSSGASRRAGTPITFQRGLNLNVIPDGQTTGRCGCERAIYCRNIEKMESRGNNMALLSRRHS